MKPHYGKIRKVKTASGSTAIQVGYYKGKRFVLTKHIGSAKEQSKIEELVSIAQEFIGSNSPQLQLNFNPQKEEILYKRGLKIKESSLQLAYTYLEYIYEKIGFEQINNKVLKHFAIIRVLEPASKIKSIKLLKKYFNIGYKKTTTFRELLKLVTLKERVTDIAIKYAKKNLGFDFTLVFYDVTTLYFETYKEDDFRRHGFSKDNKLNQPQVLIGLVVNEIGFPIYYDIFKGNTYEGKTMIPIISSLKKKYKIDKFMVIADAGMLSENNLKELGKEQIDYVVGSRVKNLNLHQARAISEALNQTDKKIIRQGNVIYEYLTKRARKDKTDNDKQIEKTRLFLNNPSKIIKRTK